MKAGVPQWPRRLPPHFAQPGLFPLPPPGLPVLDGGSSKVAVQRYRRRAGVYHDRCAAHASMNEMFGCELPHAGPITPAQESAEKHIARLCARAYVPPVHTSDREAFRELLASKSHYCLQGSTVEPYNPSTASLPTGDRPPVPFSTALSAVAQATYRVENLLADEDVVRHRQLEEPIQAFTDVPLRDRDAMLGFLQRLFKAQILGFSVTKKSRITPFFSSRRRRASSV